MPRCIYVMWMIEKIKMFGLYQVNVSASTHRRPEIGRHAGPEFLLLVRFRVLGT